MYALKEPNEIKVSIVGWKIFRIAALWMGKATKRIRGAVRTITSHEAKRWSACGGSAISYCVKRSMSQSLIGWCQLITIEMVIAGSAKSAAKKSARAAPLR